MRLYAILVYILLLNLVFGFVATAINNGIFLPDARGVVALPTTDAFTEGINSLNTSLQSLQNASGFEWIGTALTVIPEFVKVALGFLFSVFGTFPAFIATILGFAGISAPIQLLQIFSIGLFILTIYSAFQIATGKWFSFVE